MAASEEPSIVRLLEAAQRDPAAAPKFLYDAYGQLRLLAERYLRAERKDHTLQATALVHEAYLRLVGGGAIDWASPAGFFAAAAETMRRVLIDHARARGRLKRGGGRQRMELGELPVMAPEDPDEFLRLDEAIERLAESQPEMAQVVRLRFFVGLDIEDVAKVLGVSAPTVKRRWQWARTWLYNETTRNGAGHERN